MLQFVCAPVPVAPTYLPPTSPNPTLSPAPGSHPQPLVADPITACLNGTLVSVASVNTWCLPALHARETRPYSLRLSLAVPAGARDGRLLGADPCAAVAREKVSQAQNREKFRALLPAFLSRSDAGSARERQGCLGEMELQRQLTPSAPALWGIDLEALPPQGRLRLALYAPPSLNEPESDTHSASSRAAGEGDDNALSWGDCLAESTALCVRDLGTSRLVHLAPKGHERLAASLGRAGEAVCSVALNARPLTVSCGFLPSAPTPTPVTYRLLIDLPGFTRDSYSPQPVARRPLDSATPTLNPPAPLVSCSLAVVEVRRRSPELLFVVDNRFPVSAKCRLTLVAEMGGEITPTLVGGRTNTGGGGTVVLGSATLPISALEGPRLLKLEPTPGTIAAPAPAQSAAWPALQICLNASPVEVG